MVALLCSAIVSLLCLRLKREKDSDSPVDDLQNRSVLMGKGGSTASLSTACSNPLGDFQASSNQRHRGGLVEHMHMTGTNKHSSPASIDTLRSRLSTNEYIHSPQARIP